MTRKSISYLIETELEKATVVLAAKAITDKLQQIAEQVAKMDANDVMPLGDSMREIFGSDRAQSFEQVVSEKLRTLTENIRDTKNAIADQIDSIETGEPMNDMATMSDEDMFNDAPVDKAEAPEVSVETDDVDTTVSDDDLENIFSDENSAGRLKKESADYKLTKGFSNLLKEGKSVKEAAEMIAEQYAMDTNMVSDIVSSMIGK